MFRSAANEIVGERYRLERQAGRGPMGTIFEGVELESGRPVRVKLLETRYTQDPRLAVRFREGYRRIAGVAHENLAAVIDYGSRDGQYYIVSEWVEGEDLGSRLGEGGALPYPQAAVIGRQISAALEAAHEGGVLHRGLKPQNVILGREGQVKVTDLGLAGVVGETGLSKTSVLSGGAGYMAPEQARGEAPGPESDTYSVGVLLYEMLTGRRPFEGSGSWSLLRRQVEEIPLQPSRVNPEVPFDLGAVVMIALRKERGARYGRAQDLGEALGATGIEAEKAADQFGAGDSGWSLTELRRAARKVQRAASVRARRLRIHTGPVVALLFILGFAVTFGTLSTIVDAAGQGRASSSVLGSLGVSGDGAIEESEAQRTKIYPRGRVPQEGEPAEVSFIGTAMMIGETSGRLEVGLELVGGGTFAFTVFAPEGFDFSRLSNGDTVQVHGTLNEDWSVTAESIVIVETGPDDPDDDQD